MKHVHGGNYSSCLLKFPFYYVCSAFINVSEPFIRKQQNLRNVYIKEFWCNIKHFLSRPLIIHNIFKVPLYIVCCYCAPPLRFRTNLIYKEKYRSCNIVPYKFLLCALFSHIYIFSSFHRMLTALASILV